jgi:hypothetical protein
MNMTFTVSCRTKLMVAGVLLVPLLVFDFTVRDDNVARHINATLGERVVLSYQQHKGIPTTCFGETEHFVTAVKVVP